MAADLLDDVADGVFFVPLEAIEDPNLVPSSIAQVLGVREAGNRPIAAELEAYLQTRQILLVLDNFEQVVAAAPAVAALLRSSPRLKVLVTSRFALQLSWEREYPVPPLALPDPQAVRSADSLVRFPAVALFVARAQAIKPDFTLTEENAGAVGEICRRLDGLPLAIELAAARIRLLPPKALLGRLVGTAGAGPLRLLTSGAKDLAARQSTLRATIDWSYRLLDPSEQALFRRLGVFVGGFDLEAVNALTTAESLPVDVLDGLTSLVTKSLVREEEVAGEPRFSALVTLRDFAREALVDHAELEAAERARATYFVAFAEEAASRLRGAEQVTWFDRLERDHDNLRAAFVSLVAKKEVGLGLRLAAALRQYWREHGHIAEWRATCAAILAVTPDSVRTVERQRVLQGEGQFAEIQGDYERAQEALIASLTLARELQDDVRVVLALEDLGTLAHHRGSLTEARAANEESLAIFRRVGDQSYIASVLNNLGFMAIDEGDYPRARANLEDALRIWRQIGNIQATAYALANLGELAHKLGEDERALGLFAESLRIARRFGDRVSLALTIEAMVGVYAALGDPIRAARLGGAAATLRQSVGNPPTDADRQALDRVMVECRNSLGDAAFAVAWSEGQTMTLEQATSAALGETEPL